MDSNHSVDHPDWELLPLAPMEFFGLEPGFKPIELKRSYNRWIRRFKPERAPDEFQRIRAAYEQLDDALRYGQLDETRYAAPSKSESEPNSSVEQAAAIEIEDLTYSTTKRLDEIEVIEVLRELRAHEPKSPQNWIQLALIADEVQRDEPLILQRTLIAGVNATGGDAEVVKFLLESCQQPLSTSETGKLVGLLSGVVATSEGETGFHASWYFFATEHLWLTLIQKAKFESFRKLFDRVCTDLAQAAHGAYLVMVLRLVRRGAYRADSEWLDDRLAEVTESYHQLPEWLQGEVDVFEWLDSYRPTRAEFLSAHSGRKQADRTVRAIATGDELEADRAFLDAQFYALDDRAEFLEVYPAGESIGPVYPILAWYADQVADRADGGNPAERSSRWGRDLREFLYSVERTTDRSWRGRTWHIANLIKLWLMAVACMLPLILFLDFTSDSESPALTWAICMLYLVLGITVWKKKWFLPLLGLGNAAFAEWLYDVKWREDCADFLEATHMPWEDFLEGIRTFNDDRVTSDGHIFNHLTQDPGLALYALALRFAK